MLRTNLSTRPFYNDRAVRAALGLFALVALGLTAFNAIQVLQLSSRNRDLREQAATEESQSRDLRRRERAVQQALDRAQLDVVQAASREANLLIDRRAFSWTDLFNRFEQTLPPDVRISAVTPQVDPDGRLVVAIVVVSRRIEDLNQFADALENTGAFKGALSRTDEPEEDGTIRSVLQAYYEPTAVPASPSSQGEVPSPGNRSAPSAGASGPDGRAGNTTAAPEPSPRSPGDGR
jgi:hypothetical protein